ncbi:hypothetical protein CU098_000519, partial [Rhizopus stolonifer]
EDKLNELKMTHDQLELSLGSTSHAYKELQRIHEEHVLDTHKKISAFESKVTLIAGEKEKLQTVNKELEEQLSEERELRKVHFNQITGVHDDKNEDSHKPPSDLLKLIQEYQQISKHPEDIFQDYFNLRAKYKQCIERNAHESDCIESLTRKLNENTKLFDRVYKELDAAKRTNIELEQQIQQEKTQRKQTEASNKELTYTMDDLKKEKDNLTASLNDTTYQLQYLLSDIERRSQPIPANLKSTHTLLGGVEITPNLPHHQLVYTNVAELQDRNKELVIQVKALNDQVQKLSDEAGKSEIIQKSDIGFYQAAVDEAKGALIELEQKNKELQSKLEKKNTECDNYQKIISQFGDGSEDANAKFAQIQETQALQRQEMDITLEQYRKETVAEVNKLKQELETCRNSDRDARLSLSEVSSQKRYLEQKIERLNTATQELNEELKSTRRQNSTLNERIAARDHELSQIRLELEDYKTRIEHLRHENTILNTRVESTTSAYKEVKENISKEAAEKAQLTSLLEVIKSRMDHFMTFGQEKAEQSVETVEKLTRELQHTRDALSFAEKQLESYKTMDQTEIQDKYKEAAVEIRLLKQKITELEQQVSDVNQERIIAQTKLVAAEEKLKTVSSNTEGTTETGNSMNAHLLVEAQDRIRALEADIENYHVIIEERKTQTEELEQKHKDFVSQCQTTIDKLLKDLEDRTATVANIQNEAQMAIAEYKALSEKNKAAQEELTSQKQALEEKLGALETTTTEQREKIQSLEATVEEKTTAHTQIEAKLVAETKIAEEQRQTINGLRADVSNLTFEISQYKATIAAASSTETSLRAELEREIHERNVSEEQWKKKLTDVEKMREQLSESVSELVAKHAQWSAAHDKESGSERAEFNRTANDIIQQLREANATLRIEKDASENNYQHERLKVRRAESEMESIKSQVIILQADLARLRQENKTLSEKEFGASSAIQMERDAFKTQNQQLMVENNSIRESKEAALLEKSKLEAEVGPLKLKVSILESQLEQTRQNLEVLTKSEKDWSARSAKLLEKYNKSDPAETENIKAELETTKAEHQKTRTELASTKSELEKLTVQKTQLESTIEGLQETIKTKETERASIAQKANERGRIAMDFKRRYEANEKSINELKEKLAEAEKKAAESDAGNNQDVDVEKLQKEKEALEEQKKAAEEAKAALEAELTTAKAESANFEKKYTSLLQKARHVQIEKNRVTKELETLKASDSSETPVLKAKITELEAELATTRKSLTDSTVEINRYKAQTSMAQNKCNRLQKELDALKASSEDSNKSAASKPAATPAVVEKPTPAVPDVVVEKPTPAEKPVTPVISAEKPTTPAASAEKTISPVEKTPAVTENVASPVAEKTVIASPVSEKAIVTTPPELAEPEDLTNKSVEAELTMEVENEVTEDVVDELAEDTTQKEVPVEVHEEGAEEEIEKTDTVDSPVVFAEEEEEDLSDVKTGVKRERNENGDGDIKEPGSP